MAQFESLDTVSYSHFVATMAVSLAVCENSVSNCGVTLNTGLGVVHGH